MEIASFIRSLPKAELHVHIEGTLEPEMMFDLAARNGIDLPFATVEEVREAYEFSDLQAFLDIYYRSAAVLVTEQDFFELMLAYLERAVADGIRRAEIFFDPQTHTERGIDFSVFMGGFADAIDAARERWGISAGMIMCFLRHLPGDAAVDTWNLAAPFVHRVVGVGLDSSESREPARVGRGGLCPGPLRRSSCSCSCRRGGATGVHHRCTRHASSRTDRPRRAMRGGSRPRRATRP
jgi:adenosine deaminase